MGLTPMAAHLGIYDRTVLCCPQVCKACLSLSLIYSPLLVHSFVSRTPEEELGSPGLAERGPWLEKKAKLMKGTRAHHPKMNFRPL